MVAPGRHRGARIHGGTVSRVGSLMRRYAASASLARNGVEIIAVGDPLGAQLDAAVRKLLLAAREDGPGLWDDVVGAAKSLRWRRLTQPQPVAFNPALRAGAEEVVRQLNLLRGAVGNDALLDEMGLAAAGLCISDPPTGDVLRRSIDEAGFGNCTVVAASRSAQTGLAPWLGGLGVVVLTASELGREDTIAKRALVVGPPRFFRPSLLTSPVTDDVRFVVPAWFGDRTVPRSALASSAERALFINARVTETGDRSEQVAFEAEAEAIEEYLPQPEWGTRQSPDREPSSDEVEARKVLLSGGLAIWLDDGDRIRALDPRQPADERVIYTDVGDVRPGTYLLLRRGANERGALYAAALSLLGKRSAEVDASQRAWKLRLSDRLSVLGYREVVRQLKAETVRTAVRARAWTEPNLIRPHSDHDFERLLGWLGIPVQPTFGHATRLRRSLYQASTDIREALERAVSASDLSMLESSGSLSLEVETEGFRGIVATRVLAIAPYSEIVERHDARVLFEDRGGQWLE